MHHGTRGAALTIGPENCVVPHSVRTWMTLQFHTLSPDCHAAVCLTFLDGLAQMCLQDCRYIRTDEECARFCGIQVTDDTNCVLDQQDIYLETVLLGTCAQYRVSLNALQQLLNDFVSCP